MSYNRECVPIGQSITLNVIFCDACGDPIDVDSSSMNLYIYDTDNIPTSIEDEVDAGLFANASNTIAEVSITKNSTGYYEYTYTVSASGVEGNWMDLWVAEIGGVKVYNSFNFAVFKTGTVKIQSIDNNTLIVVLLNKDIADTDGNTLGSEIQTVFSTVYTPYYASPDLVRLECGPWLNSIPDDTLSLLIHWSSKEADAITKIIKNQGMYSLAKTKFVVFDVALRALTLPVDIGGGQKKLSDLMITKNRSFNDTIKELKRKREEWFRVVNSGGRIVPGQSYAPSVAVKGLLDPDRGKIGRGWHSSTAFPYPQPAGNYKLRKSNSRKFKTGYVDFVENSVFSNGIKEPD